MNEASPIANVGNMLGESPRWHSRENTLYWVDIKQGEIHTLSLENMKHEVYNIGTPVGCLSFRDSGGLVLATGRGFMYWSEREGITQIIDPRTGSEEGRFNDGAVDPQGRFWAGTMTPEGSNNCLYRLDPDGSVERMETGIAISNGIGWSPDGTTCYFTDSPKRTIYAYDFDTSEGKIFDRRVWVHTPDDPGVPDGLVVDHEGCVWSARWDGWKVERYDPDGKLISEIRVPCQRPTSCTFGGEELGTLFITSAREGLDERALLEQPFAGDLFHTETETRGLGTAFFSG